MFETIISGTISKPTVDNMPLYVYLSEEEKIKSKFKIGNVIIYLPKKYNWFQKKMYKIFFDIDLEKV